jgi:hypothetical protein
MTGLGLGRPSIDTEESRDAGSARAHRSRKRSSRRCSILAGAHVILAARGGGSRTGGRRVPPTSCQVVHYHGRWYAQAMAFHQIPSRSSGVQAPIR